MEQITIDKIVTKDRFGGEYTIIGDMENGYEINKEGKWVPHVYLSEITRRISSIDKIVGKLYCECGRVFLINDNLKLFKCEY